MLKWLDLDDCRKLVPVTELPPSLLYLNAINCTYLDTDSTQRSLLENMLQTFSKDPPDEDFSFLPRVQVPCKFDFQTIEASITIPSIPKSGLHGFVFCIILSEGFDVYNHLIHCMIFEHGIEVDRHGIGHEDYIGTLTSDHVLICWHRYNRENIGSYDYNLSFHFIHEGYKDQSWWSTEGIKGCGVLPVYDLEHESDLDGREIGKLKFSAQYSDGSDLSNNESEDGQESYNDELQPTSIGGEVIAQDSDEFDCLLENDIDEVKSSKNENEDDQKYPCCSIGLFLRHLLRGSQE